MFSGIVEEQGRVVSLEPLSGGVRLTVQTGLSLEDITLGSSISVNGVCLTVVEKKGQSLAFDVMPESLRRSNLEALRPGSGVNLERSLKVGDRISGHFVSGHVDARLTLQARRTEGNSEVLQFPIPPALNGYLVEKGSVALDGVSLTVGQVTPSSFSVYLVPHTAAVTTLGALQVGETVNCEIDIFARYVRAAFSGHQVSEMPGEKP